MSVDSFSINFNSSSDRPGEILFMLSYKSNTCKFKTEGYKFIGADFAEFDMARSTEKSAWFSLGLKQSALTSKWLWVLPAEFRRRTPESRPPEAPAPYIWVGTEFWCMIPGVLDVGGLRSWNIPGSTDWTVVNPFLWLLSSKTVYKSVRFKHARITGDCHFGSVLILEKYFLPVNSYDSRGIVSMQYSILSCSHSRGDVWGGDFEGQGTSLPLKSIHWFPFVPRLDKQRLEDLALLNPGEPRLRKTKINATVCISE